MPVTRGAKKALRSSLRKKVRNLVVKNKLKGLLKEELAFLAQKNIEEAKKSLPIVFKAIDKAVKIGLLKKNTAARRKSRLARNLNKLAS